MDIKLACGKIAQIDEEDIGLFEGHRNWRAYSNGHHNWYVRRFTRINKKVKIIHLHREIMGVTDIKIVIDHIDGNGLNNQKSNLRACTHAQNMQNSRSKSDKKSSKYKGVSLNKYKAKCREGGVKIRKRWGARITHNNKRIYIGGFSTEIEAALAYNKKAIEYHGEFACLNEI